MGFDLAEIMPGMTYCPVKSRSSAGSGTMENGEAWRLWAEDAGPSPEAAQTWFSKLPAEWHSTTWVTERTLTSWINTKVKRTRSAPGFLIRTRTILSIARPESSPPRG